MNSARAGSSIHAGVACKSNQCMKFKRLCRYITRPAISEQRLSPASNGNVIVALKRS
ncbi:MAG: transposase [Pseudomonadales bacterium]|nr:transposase [Pseudomonadales bacterium]